MSCISVENIKQGMILSEDVRDINNRLLLVKDQEITPKQIRILKIWGITAVNVVDEQGISEQEESRVSPEVIKQVEEATKNTFKNVDLDHPAMSEIFRLSVLHRSQHHKSIKDNENELISGEKPAGDFRADIRKKIEQQSLTLPEIPSIVNELNEATADPHASANDISKIVVKSPSLTAILLKIANSAFYSFPFKIDNISRAITLIGSKEITGLALGISVMQVFKDISPKFIDMRSFLKHSLACGLVARILASQKNISQTEQMFVAGLLHDIGRLIIYKYFPDQAKNLFQMLTASSRSLYHAEGSYLRCRHPEIGRFLFKKWNLPKQLEDSMFYHHRPTNSQKPIEAGIVHIADIIVNGLGLGSSGERFIPLFDDSVWEKLELIPTIFKSIIDQVTHQLSVFETLLMKEI